MNREKHMKIQKIAAEIDKNYTDYFVWFVATASMFGSLYFSEIMRLQPCMLCWWQRIFMYPTAFIMSAAILRKDPKVVFYILPISVPGMIIAFYHTLLQWGWIRETVVDCSINSAVSCTAVQINWLGFMTIPFMSFAAFLAINVLFGLRIYLMRQAKKAA